MSAPLTREEASRVLGVPSTADGRAVKQAYRRLAREHHPDRGGDPGTFHRLQRAYERLVQDDHPAPPQVARGRPSRPARPDRHERPADVDSVAWSPPHEALAGPLDHDRLAILLARDADGPVCPVVATSRAPGARLNRIAANLSPAFTSWLRIRPVTDDRGRTVIQAEVEAGGRKARRALDHIELEEPWTRTRRSSSTVLRAVLHPAVSRRASAVYVADEVTAVLAALRWPLGEWTVTDEGR